MQTWTATITQIQPIPNKDRIVLATVNGFQAIVPADEYKVGDIVMYISEASIIPQPLQAELGLEGRLAGGSKDRVKTIKMGGVFSQGIICRPGVWQLQGCPEGDDWDTLLGVTKFEPVIPIHLSGKVGRPKGNAPIAPMYDIENIKKQRHMRYNHDPVTGEPVGDGWWADPFLGETVIITEKLHGTNFAVHVNRESTDEHSEGPWDPPYIYSKGLGKNGHVLLEDANNTYWRAWNKYPEIWQWLCEEADQSCDPSVTIRGEIIGQGIQDLDYGVDFDLVIFAVEFHDSWGTRSFHPSQLHPAHPFPETVPVIPILWSGTYDYDIAVDLSTGNNLYGQTGKHVREGVVVAHTQLYRQMNGQRYAAKFINPDYLTRKGGTEFN